MQTLRFVFNVCIFTRYFVLLLYGKASGDDGRESKGMADEDEQRSLEYIQSTFGE